jgi:hypothetical protein
VTSFYGSHRWVISFFSSSRRDDEKHKHNGNMRARLTSRANFSLSTLVCAKSGFFWHQIPLSQSLWLWFLVTDANRFFLPEFHRLFTIVAAGKYSFSSALHLGMMKNTNTMATCVRDRVKSGFSSLDSSGCEIRVLLTTLFYRDHCDFSCFADADYFLFLGHPSCFILAVFGKWIHFSLCHVPLEWWKTKNTMASCVRNPVYWL